MSDLGAEVNAQMVAMPYGGEIVLPSGIFPFSTRIQCPISQNATYRIRGVAQQSYTTGLGVLVDNSGGTQLVWEGSGTAIDQTITDPNYQWEALKGCEFSDFSLINQGDPGSTGIAFASTQHTRIERVTISGFYNGVLVQNPLGGTTERYKIHALLENNTFGIHFLPSFGGSFSFGYGDIDVDLLLRASSTSRCAIFLDGVVPGAIYNSRIRIRGNVFGSTDDWKKWQYLFLIGGKASVSSNIIELMCEADGQGTCGVWQNWGLVKGNTITQYLMGAWRNVGNPVS